MARKTSFNIGEDIRFKGLSAEGAAPSDVKLIDASKIHPSPYNEGLQMDRVGEYAASMKEHGLIEPVIVYDIGGGEYELLSGHMRYEAWCHVLGNATIRAVVRPYEGDPVKRFMAHTQANTLTRDLNLNFWLTRIDNAKKVLRDAGFEGTKEEEIRQISAMLNGISRAQLFRYEGFRKLVPHLQSLEAKGWLSANTLYRAVGLDSEQQEEVYRRVIAMQKNAEPENERMHTDFEITRDEFIRIVQEVRRLGDEMSGNDGAGDPSMAVSKFHGRIETAENRYFKCFVKVKNAQERDEALESIRRVRASLDAMEDELGKKVF